MRLRVAAAAAAFLLGAACAHVEAPSGGPEDELPPALLTTRPDSLAVVPRWDAPVVLVFDERVSERGVRDAVLVSPRTSAVEVEHRGDEIRVRLRGGWRPGTIYHVTVLPGVQDLFGNPVTVPATLVFSTGPEIPGNVVEGVVTDPITGRPEAGVRVEAIRAADSLVYAVPSDTAGAYRIGRIPPGDYEVRAFRDLNRNRALDPFEPRAAATLSLAAADSATRPLGILMPDSTAPAVAEVALVDSVTVEVTFDDYLDPEQEFVPASVQIQGPQGRFVPVSAVEVGSPEGAGSGRARGGDAPADSAAAPRLPSKTLRVTLTDPAAIEPEAEYSVRVRAVRNLLGLEGAAEGTLVAPRAAPRRPAPPDSLAPGDTLAPRDTLAPADTARVVRR